MGETQESSTSTAAVATPSRRVPARARRSYHALGLLLVLIVAATLRLVEIDAQSLWFDEFVTLTQSTGTRADIIGSNGVASGQIVQGFPHPTSLADARPLRGLWSLQADINSHPPLYYVLVRLWREMVGESDVAGRLLSTIASLLAVVLIYAWTAALIDRTTALWASLLMAVSVSEIAYGIELRTYALVTAISLLALWLLVRIERDAATWRRVIPLGLCFLALPLLHYFAVGGLLGLAVYALIRLRGRAMRRVVLAAGLAALVFAVVWGPQMWSQRNRFSFAYLDERENPEHLSLTITRTLLIPLRLLGEPRDMVRLEGGIRLPVPAADALAERSPGVVSATTVICCAVGVLFVATSLVLLRRQPRLLLPVLWFVGSVALVLVIDLTRSTHQLDFIRYVLPAAPAVYLLIPAIASRAPGRVRHGVPALAVVLALSQLTNLQLPRNEDWRTSAAIIATDPDAPIAMVAPQYEQWFAAMMYVGISHYEYSPTRRYVYLNRPPRPEIARALGGDEPIWAISTGGLYPEQIFPGCRVQHVASSPRIGVISRVWIPPGWTTPAMHIPIPGAASESPD